MSLAERWRLVPWRERIFLALCLAVAIAFAWYQSTQPPAPLVEKPALTPEQQAAPSSVQNQPTAHQALSVVALKVLKNSMKDPDSFELKSLIVHPSGTACYEYRATNSFNAHIAGAAVLTPKGEFLTQEHNGNAFVTAWNKGCTPADGEDMTAVAELFLRN